MKNINKLFKIILNKFPFILVDKIIYIKKCSIKTLKNVTYNEPYFKGHFINNPIMPGSLIIENIAQTSSLLLYKKYNLNYKNSKCYLISIEKIIFKFSIYPGDRITTKSIYINKKLNFVKLNTSVVRDEKILCKSIMIFYILK